MPSRRSDCLDEPSAVTSPEPVMVELTALGVLAVTVTVPSDFETGINLITTTF